MDTSLDNIKLSRRQINDMQHCIKKGWFATSPSDSWQELVDMGLSTVSRDPFNRNDVVYRLTPKGRDWLAKALYQI